MTKRAGRGEPEVAVATLFLDAKRRREESWLGEEHPEYAAYRREVRNSLVPFVW